MTSIQERSTCLARLPSRSRRGSPRALALERPAHLHVGCAGWSLPRATWDEFGAGGSHLERYATRFNAVEINSSFYKPHGIQTYERWASSTPVDFAFSVKLPKSITHELRLVGAMPVLDRFLDQVQGLGARLRCLLVQLPPSLVFEARVANRFAAQLRQRYAGLVAVEPRHATWFSQEADTLLATFGFARVLADPVLHDAGAEPGGSRESIYLRLHGSPRMYWSRYEEALLTALAERISAAIADAHRCWCIFDNTAGGESVGNALRLKAMLAAVERSSTGGVPSPINSPEATTRR